MDYLIGGEFCLEYIFENEIALEIYYLITKELKIKLTPMRFKNSVYMSEKFLMTCLAEIYAIKEKKTPTLLNMPPNVS